MFCGMMAIRNGIELNGRITTTVIFELSIIGLIDKPTCATHLARGIVGPVGSGCHCCKNRDDHLFWGVVH